jgi:hypothetical protein
MVTTAGCHDNSTDSGCYHVEGLAYSDSVAILNTVHAGGELQVRIVGWVGLCYSILRVESESRGDTILLRPISGGITCPHSPCPGLLESFADTVAVPAEHAGPLWVRVEVHYGRLVDSTVVLPAGVRMS